VSPRARGPVATNLEKKHRPALKDTSSRHCAQRVVGCGSRGTGRDTETAFRQARLRGAWGRTVRGAPAPFTGPRLVFHLLNGT
jgi:hypothetical protein